MRSLLCPGGTKKPRSPMLLPAFAGLSKICRCSLPVSHALHCLLYGTFPIHTTPSSLDEMNCSLSCTFSSVQSQNFPRHHTRLADLAASARRRSLLNTLTATTRTTRLSCGRALKALSH